MIFISIFVQSFEFPLHVGRFYQASALRREPFNVIVDETLVDFFSEKF